MRKYHDTIKWICRFTLFVLTSLMTYVVVQPEYNFAHWVPHRFLRNIGVSYPTLLSFEQNADKWLHLFGAFTLTLLLHFSRIFTLRTAGAIIFLMIIGAEVVQWLIGRGYSVVDFLLGVLGLLIACLLIARHTTTPKLLK